MMLFIKRTKNNYLPGFYRVFLKSREYCFVAGLGHRKGKFDEWLEERRGVVCAYSGWIGIELAVLLKEGVKVGK